MDAMLSNKTYTYIGLAVSLILAGALLFPGIGRFGMWEPLETDRADVASAIADNAEIPGGAPSGMHLEERLAALCWSLGDKSELTARLPLAVLGFVAVTALFLLLVPLAGPRVSLFAAVAAASAPVFLFHGRQLTFGMPLLLGEVLSVCGLACFAYGRGTRTVAAGAVAALAGLIISWLEAGVLIGIAVPAGAIALALALSGDAAAIFRPKDAAFSKHKQAAFFIAAPLAVLAAGAFFVTVLLLDKDIPMITGGVAASAGKTFEFSLKQLAFGWFPWSALAPISIISYFADKDSHDDQERALRCLAVAGLVTGFFAWTFSATVRGASPIFLTVPMSLSVAFAVRDLEKSEEPQRLGALIGIACLAIMIRDFAQQPDIILSGFGFEKIALPKDFKPIAPAAMAAAPVGLLILILGFLGSGGQRPAKWRSFRSLTLAPISAAVFGGYISFFLVPGLSVDLSSKYAEQAYKRFKKGDEALAVYGAGRFDPNAEQLKSKDEVVEWLLRGQRSFVMFPPRDLADINNRVRRKAGRHIYVLDAKSDRFILATSELHGKEKSSNPIAPFVSSRPFSPGPENVLEVNFDNKITLLGWTARSDAGRPRLVKGKGVTFETFWRCEDKIPGKYQIFMHIDGPGGRMHGDHDPLGDIYPTGNWEEGDYIKDVYKRDVPIYQKEGTYQVRIGFFKGSERLKVVDYPRAVENSVLIGALEID
jgi:hypothetical protein